MDRVITMEERIKRAEEIYNRRRQETNLNTRINLKTNKYIDEKEKIKFSLFKKMILQILICIVIYLIFSLIKNTDYFFSNDVINKTKEFLAYDINFSNLYNNLINYYENNIKNFFVTNNIDDTNELTVNETVNEVINETTNEEVNEIKDINIEAGIGGGEDTDKKEEQELTQMEKDANEIKNNYSLILPLVGTITSRFGPRTPTDIVSANHKGIDIAVNEGTVFVASMEGKVTVASSEGSYGNHIFIENNDVITIYAHCKTLYVKQGDVISQGQKLGEVGHTGNATGPHLHFEIRKDGRHVNPEYILDF